MSATSMIPGQPLPLLQLPVSSQNSHEAMSLLAQSSSTAPQPQSQPSPVPKKLGLQVHSTAGFIDPGFDGHVTLELSNVANLPITLYPEMKIGQLSFLDLDGPAEQPYGSGALGSKYQGQVGPTPSAYWLNFT